MLSAHMWKLESLPACVYVLFKKKKIVSKCPETSNNNILSLMVVYHLDTKFSVTRVTPKCFGQLAKYVGKFLLTGLVGKIMTIFR